MKHALCLFLLIFSNICLADLRLIKVSGSKALFECRGESFHKGDHWQAFDRQNKAIAILTIRQIRNEKCVVGIDSGSLENATSFRSIAENRKSGLWSWGLGLFGLSSQIKAKLSTGSEVALSGSSPGFEVLADWNLWSHGRLRGHLSALTLEGDGRLSSGVCGGSANCTVKVGYLSPRLEAQAFTSGKIFRGYIGGGFGLHLPVSKSSNILETSKISLTQTFDMNTGIELSLGSNSLDLGLGTLLFPSGDVVQAQQVGLFVQLMRPL